MVDNFAIAVSHLLVAIAAWRLVWRADLDRETPPPADEAGSGFFTKQTVRTGPGERDGRGERDA